jgi:two-component system, OmpR family, sensor kinase
MGAGIMLRSIRWTLQLWHAAILLVALLSFAIAMYAASSRSEFARVDAELEGAARVLASGPMGPPPFGQRQPDGGGLFQFTHDGDGLADRPHEHDNGPPHGGPRDWWEQVPRDALNRIGQDQRDQPYFSIWGSDGSVLRASAPSADIPAPTSFARASSSSSGAASLPQFRQRGAQREVILSGPHGAMVLVGKSVIAEQEALSHLRWMLFAAGAGVLGIGLIGGWLLSERATRPIRIISATARAISASDLSRRIAVQETKSELGSLAQTLNDTFARLETAFDRQVRFTADASHELRTPLAVIHSHAELALAKDRAASEYKQALETCLRASRRMKSLVESLLVLARADAGKLELNYQRVELGEVAQECLALIVPEARQRNVRIESDIQDVQIEADRTRIGQLITNLLSNAVRYNREGGSVHLAIRNGDQAVLTVADTGVGITPVDQRQIFERFFRADASRSREAGGSGLGLAICQSIVEAHKGEISFASEPETGTTFTVRLPLFPPAD